MTNNKQRVELWGNANDPQVQRSADKIKRSGRKVKVVRSPGHDTGTGVCGHLCGCENVCAYKGDEGPMYGRSF